jgi:hypothetical protein
MPRKSPFPLAVLLHNAIGSAIGEGFDPLLERSNLKDATIFAWGTPLACPLFAKDWKISAPQFVA